MAPGRGGVDGAGHTGRGCGGRGGGHAPPGRRAAPGRAPGRGGGRAGSGPRFNRTELEHLNEIVERILPIGPDEWEAVAMQHSDLYPTHNRCMANLKRKFRDMCSHQPPTGDPTCPPYIVSAKRIQRLIEERSDADNLDGDDADIGFDDSGEEANEDGAVQEVAQGQEGGDKPNGVQRRLFDVPAARPLVRTPVSASRPNASRPNDILSIALASFLSNAKSEETDKQDRLDRLAAEKQEKLERKAAEKEEKKERQQRELEMREREQRREDRQRMLDREERQDRRVSNMMMMALISSLNPAAAAVMQPFQAALMQPQQPIPQNEQPQNEQPYQNEQPQNEQVDGNN